MFFRRPEVLRLHLIAGTKQQRAGLRVGSQTLAGLKIDQCRRYAEDCVRMAQETRIAEHRTILLDMAQSWIEVAEQGGRLQEPDNSGQGRPRAPDE